MQEVLERSPMDSLPKDVLACALAFINKLEDIYRLKRVNKRFYLAVDLVPQLLIAHPAILLKHLKELDRRLESLIKAANKYDALDVYREKIMPYLINNNPLPLHLHAEVKDLLAQQLYVPENEANILPKRMIVVFFVLFFLLPFLYLIGEIVLRKLFVWQKLSIELIDQVSHVAGQVWFIPLLFPVLYGLCFFGINTYRSIRYGHDQVWVREVVDEFEPIINKSYADFIEKSQENLPNISQQKSLVAARISFFNELKKATEKQNDEFTLVKEMALMSGRVRQFKNEAVLISEAARNKYHQYRHIQHDLPAPLLLWAKENKPWQDSKAIKDVKKSEAITEIDNIDSACSLEMKKNV